MYFIPTRAFSKEYFKCCGNGLRAIRLLSAEPEFAPSHPLMVGAEERRQQTRKHTYIGTGALELCKSLVKINWGT